MEKSYQKMGILINKYFPYILLFANNQMVMGLDEGNVKILEEGGHESSKKTL